MSCHKNTGVCLYPDCERPNHTRGLCESHYQRMRRNVKMGLVDEDDLMARGLLKRVSPLSKVDQLDAFIAGSTIKGENK